MERSAELEAITRRWWEGFRGGDVDSVVALLTDRDDLLFLGSDPGEWWWGADNHAVFARQFEEMGGGIPFEAVAVEAWVEGTVGWSVSDLRLHVEPDPVQMRFTAVFHLERGQWRMVHGHTSVAVPNVEHLGVELTTAVDRIAEVVERERPDLAAVVPPGGTVTLLFTDIEGSTERNAALGDGAWLEVLGRHHALVRAQIAGNAGYEVKSLGDGFMVAFASARQGLACALDIQRAVGKEADLDVRVRAGLHAGEAVRVGDDFYGGVVNMAARVAGQARGGEVVVSSVVRALVEPSGEFAFDPPRVVELKGFSGSHEVHPVRP